MRKVLFVAMLTVSVSCSDSDAESPSRPSPTPPQTFMLSGTVSETAPTTSTRIAGATVTILIGPNAGQSAKTDSNGSFQLGALPGNFAISTRAGNYIERISDVALSQNQSVAIELDPVLQIVTATTDESIQGNQACPGWWDGFVPSDPCKAERVINVHHNGTLTAQLTWPHSTVEPFMQLYAVANGQPSGGAIASSEDGSGQMIRADVVGHTQYVIQVRMFGNGGGPPGAGVRPFRLTTTGPN
jgi:hypothetical protein